MAEDKRILTIENIQSVVDELDLDYLLNEYSDWDNQASLRQVVNYYLEAGEVEHEYKDRYLLATLIQERIYREYSYI